jgi:3-oxoacyl-[acyl-carrier protein] reductase
MTTASRTLDGRIALVTGAGAGLGRAYALALAAEGAALAVNDVEARAAEAVGAEIRAAGGRAVAVPFDVSDVAAVRAGVAHAEREWGAIDVLVNNAGIDEGKTTPEIDERAYDRMMAVHVKGSFFTTQAAVAGMKARRRGCILNISSINGMIADATDPHYNAAKAAILGLTRSLAKELAPWNIVVNTVAPGHVVTEATRLRGAERMAMVSETRIPLRRYAAPEEIAHAVVFLAGPGGAFITGQVLSPNGGEAIVGF